MNEPTPMPGAWCAARRAEIQAYVDGSGQRPAQQTRTYLIELLAQLQQMQMAHDAEKRLLIMRADSANWAAAELEAENKMLRNTIAARDQWAAQLTQQYAKLIKLLATKYNINLDEPESVEWCSQCGAQVEGYHACQMTFNETED